jgi:hypothetical protein
VSAETSVVPGTVLDFGLPVNVKEIAFLVAALVVFGEEVALGHLAHVVLVQEFTLVALFAQTAQPVLAHD